MASAVPGWVARQAGRRPNAAGCIVAHGRAHCTGLFIPAGHGGDTEDDEGSDGTGDDDDEDDDGDDNDGGRAEEAASAGAGARRRGRGDRAMEAEMMSMLALIMPPMMANISSNVASAVMHELMATGAHRGGALNGRAVSSAALGGLTAEPQRPVA